MTNTLTSLLWLTTFLAFTASVASLYRSWVWRAAHQRWVATIDRVELLVATLEREEAAARSEEQS